ncbi:uncharacterized protein N7484_009769 [Penicillium longicatenatum]|uniref:uncharacterized protein n=1 Tax=Penicillium longicatenatum TaxID=1561947 RepID=UPI00254897F0|nr:uncharacterized protein N7484_009769 [Penicillium longicatenatum]KAJ5636456.1 hypothetical protein N7484_009769 [Penicillium longicatenatum]
MSTTPIPDPPKWWYQRWWCILQGLKGINGSTLTEQDVPRKDMRGKWVIITGANNGIGFEAAKTFATWGANIIMACREPPKWETHPSEAVEHCLDLAKSSGHSSTIEWWPIDMTVLASVDEFAERWLATGRALDVLCNNAGIAPHCTDQSMTKDGFQIVHQVNFLSHTLLAFRILDSLARSAEPRIVCTTSNLHFFGKLEFEKENLPVAKQRGPYENNKLYYQIWIAEMHRRLVSSDKYRHITINGIHPGFVNSGIWNFSEKNQGSWHETIFKFFTGYLTITSEQGSFAIVNAATSAEFGPDPEVQGRGEPGAKGGGNYINRIWKATPMPFVDDAVTRLRIWNGVATELRAAREKLYVLDELDAEGV